MEAGSPRERLVHAAERVFAERGIDATLREVAAAAGHRNNSAVQYHFGSRDGLIEAVLRLRLESMERRRAALLAELESRPRPPRVADYVAVLVHPTLTTPYEEGATHYARFLEQARIHPAIAEAAIDDARWPATYMATMRLNRLLSAPPTDLPSAVRRRRLEMLPGILFHMAAECERRAAPLPPAPADIAEVTAMVAGMVAAGAPTATELPRAAADMATAAAAGGA